jgi:hypothetical protein
VILDKIWFGPWAYILTLKTATKQLNHGSKSPVGWGLSALLAITNSQLCYTALLCNIKGQKR